MHDPDGDERLTLRLSSLAFGGDAVGRDDDGRVTFVPGGAPGDLVQVRVTERKRSYARAELEEVVEPGARVAAPCPLAARGADSCGGCPWQHVEGQAQLAAKEQIVRHALARALGEGELPVETILPAPAWLGYRTRARMTGRGRAVGFHAQRSHRVIDVDHCLALDPRLDVALQAARRALGSALGEAGTLSGLVAPDGRVHLSVECGYDPAPETLADLAAELLHQHEIVGVTVRSLETTRVYGDPLLDVGAGHLASAAGFAQANFAQNEVLRRLVRTWALPESDAPRRLLELYAGDGNFTRDLVAHAQVVAVESDRDAAARLIENLRVAAPRTPDAPQRWTVRTESAVSAVRKLAEAGERFDVAVLDPPRSGALDALPWLAALSPWRLVYVSCDPMTLARDLARLAELGYRTARVQPIDMMPHTAHVEVVTLLERD